jgi:cytochrome P450
VPVDAKLPPRPPAPPILGHVPQWRRDPVGFVTAAARCGDVVQLALPGRTYLLTHPRDVKHVLQDNNQNYCKGWVFDRIKPYWGESLLTAEGERWRAQRRRIQPSFKREHTTGFAPIITKRTHEMLERWEKASEAGTELVLYNEMTQLALVIIADVLFGVELWGDAAGMTTSVQTALRVLKTRVSAIAPLPLWIPTPQNRRFNRAMHTLNSRVAEIVQRSRSASERRTFVKMLMEAQDSETGAPMTDEHLHEEIIGMLQQGHDTIGETLAWTWYLLSLHPEVERKLSIEIARVVGSRTPTVADLERLTYAHLIIQESLRLFPPVWMIPRQAIADDVVAGYRIPARSTVLVSPYLTHRHAEFWDNPEAFDPERFDPVASRDRPRYAFFPFGGGPRRCMGTDMAMMETLLILTMVVQRYRLHLVSGHREEPECIIDMVPRHGVRASLHRRHSSVGREPIAFPQPEATLRPDDVASDVCPWHAARAGGG